MDLHLQVFLLNIPTICVSFPCLVVCLAFILVTVLTEPLLSHTDVSASLQRKVAYGWLIPNSVSD